MKLDCKLLIFSSLFVLSTGLWPGLEVGDRGVFRLQDCQGSCLDQGSDISRSGGKGKAKGGGKAKGKGKSQKKGKNTQGMYGVCTPEVVAIKKTRVIPVAVRVKSKKKTYAIQLPTPMVPNQKTFIPQQKAFSFSHFPEPWPKLVTPKISYSPSSIHEEVFEEEIEEQPQDSWSEYGW